MVRRIGDLASVLLGPVTGGPVDSGHYLAEESPQEVVGQFFSFFE